MSAVLVASMMLVAPLVPAQAADLSYGSYSSTYTPSYSSTYTPSYSSTYSPSYSGYSYSSDYSSTYTPSYSSTYSPDYSSYYSPSYSSTYTPDYSSTYTPSYSSTYSPEYSSTYTPEYSSTYTPSYSSSYSSYSYPSYSYYSGSYYSNGCGSSCYSYTPPCYSCETPKPKPKPAPTCEMWATRTNIEKGDSTTLKWESENARSARMNQGIGSVSTEGSRSVSPERTTTYTATFESKDGKEVTCSETITVEKKEREHKAPQCDMWISDSRVERGDRVTVSWDSKNVDEVSINNGIGDVDTEGSKTVRVERSTTYIGTFYGTDGGSIKCSVEVDVERDVPPPTHKTPYITLDSVPYTGLELGPVGTFVYYAFLIFWAAFAAYLIAVKRIHNDVYNMLKAMLYGTPAVAQQKAGTQMVWPESRMTAAEGEPRTFAGRVSVKPASVPPHDLTEGVDPFIASQISRKIS